MHISLKAILIVATSVLTTFGAHAQPLPSGAPAGTTVECKDGSFASPEAKSGACSGHKGIKTWYGKAEAKTPAPAPSVETQSAAVNSTNVAPSTGKASKTPAVQDPSKMEAAPGGGAGKVWVNESTKVYHCIGDRYYGKTKKGEYLSEADAKAKGNRAAYKKTCGG